MADIIGLGTAGQNSSRQPGHRRLHGLKAQSQTIAVLSCGEPVSRS